MRNREAINFLNQIITNLYRFDLVYCPLLPLGKTRAQRDSIKKPSEIGLDKSWWHKMKIEIRLFYAVVLAIDCYRCGFGGIMFRHVIVFDCYSFKGYASINPVGGVGLTTNSSLNYNKKLQCAGS